MKNFKYLFAFLAIGFVSCETDTGDESFMENRTVIAGYTDSSVNLLASAAGPNTYNLTVAVSQIAKSDMAFDIVIDDNSTAVLGTDFTLSGSSVVIPAGSFSGSVTVEADYYAASVEGKELIFNLVAPQGAIIGKGKSCTINLIKKCVSSLDGVEFNWVTTDWYYKGTGLTALGYPDASGTDAFEAIDDISYTFESGCFDFGYYATVYEDDSGCGQGTGNGGTIKIEDICEKLIMSGADQWGDTWEMWDVSVDGSSLTYTWENTWGERGTTTLTRTDGEDFLNYYSE
jgi:hypothetical protein